MKYKNFTKSIYLAFTVLLLVGCNQTEIGPLEKNTTPPGQLSNIEVENLPGGAKISYKIPTDQDLLYIKATYTLASGKEVELKSSYYKNFIEIVGFGDTKEREVKLYTVNRSETVSEPSVVKIKPLESPIWEVYRKLAAKPTFGGIYLSTLNKTRADIAILIMEKDEYGDWVIDDKSLYTATDTINRAIRPFEFTEKEYAFTVRDRWLNTTDTLFTKINPFPEIPLPKSNYGVYILPNDTPTHPSTPTTKMWDGGFLNWGSVFLTDKNEPDAHLVTFDIGSLSNLSRIQIWDYPEYFDNGSKRMYYYIGNLKIFEIWGAVAPNPDGSFDESWIKMGSFTAAPKPSGLPYGQYDPEDFETGQQGFSYDLDPGAPAVRYLRIKSIENWGGTGSMGIAEVQLFGAVN